MALEQKHYREAIRVIRSSKVDSQAIIGYLERNGFEDIALYFVTEPRARFNLAIRCGNLDIANECATQLNEPAIWNELAAEALRQGNHAIVEICYQQTRASRSSPSSTWSPATARSSRRCWRSPTAARTP